MVKQYRESHRLLKPHSQKAHSAVTMLLATKVVMPKKRRRFILARKPGGVLEGETGCMLDRSNNTLHSKGKMRVMIRSLTTIKIPTRSATTTKVVVMMRATMRMTEGMAEQTVTRPTKETWVETPIRQLKKATKKKKTRWTLKAKKMNVATSFHDDDDYGHDDQAQNEDPDPDVVMEKRATGSRERGESVRRHSAGKKQAQAETTNTHSSSHSNASSGKKKEVVVVRRVVERKVAGAEPTAAEQRPAVEERLVGA